MARCFVAPLTIGAGALDRVAATGGEIVVTLVHEGAVRVENRYSHLLLESVRRVPRG